MTQKYQALAYCYRAGQRSLYEKFPSLNDYDIDWTYIDTHSDTEIKGNIYSPITLMESLEKLPEGYDFIVIDGCPIGNSRGKLLYYNLMAPLISGSCLLKDGGILMSNNFVFFALQYIDKTIYDIRVAEYTDKELFKKLGQELLVNEGINIQDNLNENVDRAISLRLQGFLKNKKYMNTILDTFLRKVCQAAEFWNYELEIYKTKTNNRATRIKFYK